ncbi:Urm1-domain-containing protein [Coemansia reversa NRRL 1564]|uniref:Ubiquitin-related modifier 1 n=1 Tax=Coemansia reversa (strain ATCC 12441 / NRRL 1564) TaxID=763665 RepID=A0A2G5B407_COERN|nr:Urm1-domain-containing protein [Coemansia reversa NRRL 1564]|eukprot:PIA13734.1 Urm1-domain-containing protein [Coemansia reversa NRRL 1564]
MASIINTENTANNAKPLLPKLDFSDGSQELIVEFGGGLEALIKQEMLKNVKGAKQTNVKFPKQINKHPATIRDLIIHLRNFYVKEKPELFCTGDKVRPGILVIINEEDWEIVEDNSDKYDYELKNKDHILFISTLHGG